MPLIPLVFASLAATAQPLRDETVLDAPTFRLTAEQIQRFLTEGYGEGVGTVHVYTSVRDLVKDGVAYFRSETRPYHRAVNFTLRRDDRVIAASCDLVVDDADDLIRTDNCAGAGGAEIRPHNALLSLFTQVQP